jgi:hypothetical protein
LVVRNCTFDFNSLEGAQAFGGGLESGGKATVINTTFSNNTLKPTGSPNSAQGGGIYNHAGNIILVNCTILGNTYLPSGGTDTVEGGGVYNYIDSSVTVQNTLIANNTAIDGADVKGVISSRGHNVVQRTAGSSGWIATDKTDAQASPLNLGGLVYNGGQNKTHALLAGSVAIDAGDDSLAVDPGPNRIFGDGDDVPLTTDERGYARKVGAAVDVGAFEFESGQSGPTFIVTTTDEHDDNVCSLADCTLLEAMNAANANANANTIQFKPGLSGTIVNTLAPQGLAILNPLTISGPGPHVITVSGAGASRVFKVFGGVTASISDLTITNGKATGDAGAGLYNDGGNLAITNCTILGNAAQQGGGIYNRSGGTTTITNCTVSGNSGNGGGVFNDAGIVNITNSTISGNSTQFFGGGIYNFSTMTITSSTIASNTAGSSGGGGVSNGSGTVTLKNTIVALNTSASGPDVKGTLASQGFNFIGNNKDGTITPAQSSDQIGAAGAPIDPLLGPLQDNGGPTFTLALQSNSPAINKGDPNAPARDQRGYVRQNAPDVGAFEFGGTIPVTLANISTRLFVQTGDNVLIAGFIITGTQNKKVILRAIGPSLNLPGELANPTLDLYQGNTLLESNDNWVDSPNKQAIIDSTIPPNDPLESAIVRSLAPGAYTAIVRGAGGGTGIGVVEAYDLDRTVDSKLANISTRGAVQTGDNVLFAGFIVLGPDSQKVIIRALGPSVPVPGALADPTLELHDSNGGTLESNDNWVESPNKQAIIDSTIPPPNDLESAIVRTLTPANYTAIVRGAGGTTGIAVVEVYALN